MTTPLYAARKSQRSTARRLRFEHNRQQRLDDARGDRLQGRQSDVILMYRLRGKQPVRERRLLRWARWYEKKDNRGISFDVIGDARVSTIFLGLDYSLLESTPVLFETMIFGGEHDQEQFRWRTWDEARAGHVKIVEQLRHEA